MNLRKLFIYGAAFLVLLGVVFRFAGITANDFIFYDEGYYLNWNRPLGEALVSHQLSGFEEFSKALYAYVSRSLASGKTLWFMLVDTRIFWGGVEQWFLARIWAAVLGVGTLGLTYLFAKQYFNNKSVALGATALLAVLPSHVFYSRIGMQESLSTLLVLAGFYCYFFPGKFGWRVLASGGLWGLAYFSNYRLIMLPLMITFCELFLAFSQKRLPDARKWLWAILIFLLCVFGIGNFNNGQNTTVIFSWIFHQAEMAGGQRDWMNVFSYPYYLFRLETFFFAAAFWFGLYFAARKEWKYLLPFALAVLQMAVFTFAGEKGARYVGVVLPFMAMTVALVVNRFWLNSVNQRMKAMVIIMAVLMTGSMCFKSFQLAVSRSDYREAVMFLKTHDQQTKILSSQPYVQRLYFKNIEDVRNVPSNFETLINDYRSGYRYLILCPQAYISLTESGNRFDPPLRNYLSFLVAQFKPHRIYRHFSPALIERFVLEHNENLPRSVKFLNTVNKENSGALRIYDLGEIILPMVNAAARSAVQTYEGGR